MLLYRSFWSNQLLNLFIGLFQVRDPVVVGILIMNVGNMWRVIIEQEWDSTMINCSSIKLTKFPPLSESRPNGEYIVKCWGGAPLCLSPDLTTETMQIFRLFVSTGPLSPPPSSSFVRSESVLATKEKGRGGGGGGGGAERRRPALSCTHGRKSSKCPSKQ